jgi:hypothetical protein
LYHWIPDLERIVWEALRRSDGHNKDGLSTDEAAAICIYTIEFGEHSLNRLLNQDLRYEDPHRLERWFPYLRLFMNALNKLPSHRCTVWRGVQADMSDKYSKGDRNLWRSVTSTTPDASLLENMYLGKTGIRTLFGIDCKNGKDINDYSFFPTEKEILLMPGFCFEVTGVTEPASNLHVIYLKEVDPFV